METLVFETVSQGKIALVNHFYDTKTGEELDYSENNFNIHCEHLSQNVEKDCDAPRLIAIEAIEAFREFCSMRIAQ